ncbi:MAG: DHHA1 domain-containing protein [Thermoanaerobaculia bacterium]
MRKGYWDNPYKFEFAASITDAYKLTDTTVGIELSETFFYPESGGQPCDAGQIENLRIVGVRYVDENRSRIVHEAKVSSPLDEVMKKLEVGNSVECRLDWPRRLINMRSHTAGHLIYGAARRLFATLEYAGFHIAGDGTASIYLKTEAPLGTEKLLELERLVNTAVVEAVKITTSFCKASEVSEIKDVIYTVDPTEIPGDQIRIVDIAGWDVSVCGGTHFSNSIEVGPVALVGRENHKKGVTRINYAVDRRALDLMNQRSRYVNEIMDVLEVPAHAAIAKIRSIADEQRNYQSEIQKFEQKLGEHLPGDLLKAARLNGDILVVTGLTRDLSQATVASVILKSARKREKSLWCVAGTKNSRYVVVAASPDLEVDVAGELSQAPELATLKGGGNRQFFQAQGVQENLQDLIRRICDVLAKKTAQLNT